MWGASGQSKVLFDILENSNYELIHLFDNDTSIKSPFPGIPISYGFKGFREFVKELQKNSSIYSFYPALN